MTQSREGRRIPGVKNSARNLKILQNRRSSTGTCSVVLEFPQEASAVWHALHSTTQRKKQLRKQSQRTIRARTGFYIAGAAASPKKLTSRRARPFSNVADTPNRSTATTTRRPDCVTEVRRGNTVLVVSGYIKQDTTADTMMKVLKAESAAGHKPPFTA